MFVRVFLFMSVTHDFFNCHFVMQRYECNQMYVTVLYLNIKKKKKEKNMKISIK